MPPLRIPIDGLWRCLCPSVDAIAVSKSSRCVSLTPSNERIGGIQRRQFCGSTSPQNISLPNLLPSTTDQLSSFSALRPNPEKDSTTPARRNTTPLKSRNISTSHSTSQLTYGKNWDVYTTAQLHDKLRDLPSNPGTYHEVAELVHYLITVRGQTPALIHYDALVRANAEAEHGSVDVVRGLMDEMEQLGIRGDSGFYHGVLLVLAIHPDYILRNEIMKAMKERWFGLSPEGWHWLVVGLLRDRHFEVAMEKLEQMQSDVITIQPWLYDMFMFQLCEMGELDEAWKLLKYRWEHDRNRILSSTYYHLLEKFSQGFHYEGVKFIWKVRVQSDIIVPSDGICISVLNLAARYSDPGLATSVMRILSSRRATLAPYHYEALITAYAGFGDLKTAFRVLTIMTKAGIEPTPSTTRPLYVHLSLDPSLPSQAWQTLEQLFEDGHVIPVAAINVAIESFIAVNRFDDAMNAYKSMHSICESGPDTETFNVLFQGSTKQKRKDASMFFASEMLALGIPADNITYDRLILVCLAQSDYEDAFRYLEEMVVVGVDRVEEGTGKVGWWMRKGTATEMVKVCVKYVDERVWDILEGMKARGMNTERLEVWVKQHWTGNLDDPVADDLKAIQEERLRRWKETS